MPFDQPAPVVRHQAIDRDHFLLTLEAPRVARAARPGQFVMLRTRPGCDPLLRRPMSIYRVPPSPRGQVQILYKVVGSGTRYLSGRAAGDSLDMLGPLGNGFRPSRPGHRPVLVAGGIGIAIFPFLVDRLLRRGSRPLLLYGARGRGDLVVLGFFRTRRVPVRLATEDGSAGVRGFVTSLLEPMLAGDAGTGPCELFVCGPTPMLRAVSALAVKAGVPCQLALESQMPCGIGVCLGCVVRCRADAGGALYRRVCTEGPIFEAGVVDP